MSNTVPAQLLAAIKNRKFGTLGKLFAPGVDFQAWNPSGHWVAQDGTTVGKIFEVWYAPGAGSTITWSNETTGARGSAILEYEVSWKLPPDDQVRVLRQVCLLTIKNDRITAARIYCAGLHTEFPEVDLDKQRRARGIGGAKPLPPQARAVAAKAS